MLKDLIKMVQNDVRANYFVVCPNSYGLSRILTKVLRKVAVEEDIKVIEASKLLVDAARGVANMTRMFSVGASKFNHIVILGMDRLPWGSEGPLLKVVEESATTRFYFQAPEITKKLKTLASRSVVVYLPFMTKKADIVTGKQKSSS